MEHQDGPRSGERLHNLRWHRLNLTPLCEVLLLTAATLIAQVAATPQAGSSTVTRDGMAHVARVLPVPNTLSPQAQHWLALAWPDDGPPQSRAERRSGTDTWRAGAVNVFEAMFRRHPHQRTRDQLLSGTTILHRAFLREDADAQLVVF